jgi:hypothetical protein
MACVRDAVAKRKRLGTLKGLGKSQDRLSAFRAAVDEHYRYHQFWGGMAVTLPVVFLGWIKERWSEGSLWNTLGISALFVLVEALTFAGALDAYEPYSERAKSILEEGT